MSSEPKEPLDVLNFWFKNSWSDPKKIAKVFNTPLWFGGDISVCHYLCTGGQSIMKPIGAERQADLDAQCKPFIPLVEAAGKGELHGELWESPDGIYARMLLCDQLPRNCFRKTPEAFKYDKVAMQLFRDIWERKLYADYAVPQVMFFVTVIEHSECPSDHELLEPVIDYFSRKHPGALPLKNLYNAARDHKAVVDRFGRFPHRNQSLGRSNTPEEDAWLSDVKKLPLWARSQMKDPKSEMHNRASMSEMCIFTKPKRQCKFESAVPSGSSE
eukprot:TRINITY_DN95512_c0_g1_i1.p1 TRINITY_DN95512_c0_g1~~TRINITY_DN95512_c0_g1_i1.p1  ORF type:complete len:281 (+),score=39.98 TRINITY_DN95512_c0_g1_i1:30-845(+)